jgi:hypothetical protein
MTETRDRFMTQKRSIAARVWLGLAVLCTGVLPGTCELRMKDALVNGTKTWVAGSLLNPDTITDLALGDATDEE